MKNSILVTAFLLLGSCAAYPQTRATKDAQGNYVQAKRADTASNKPTGHTFTDKDGKSYPVFISARGKLYYMRTSKYGNVYKAYLKEE